jgi:outer membrane protein OmpA-like peptidoglycan-associated protein
MEKNRMRRPRVRRLCVFAAGVSAALVLGACTSGNTPPGNPECTAANGLVIAVSVHQNVAAPKLPRELRCTVRETISARRPISLVAIDGTPHVLARQLTYDVISEADNPDAHDNDVTLGFNDVSARIRKATADSDGSDVLNALAVAADVAVSGNTPKATIVVIDSGAADTGALRLTDPGVTDAQPSDVATALSNRGALPRLSGFHVELVGFGYTVEPQPRLPDRQRRAIIDIWTATLKQAGARVSLLPVARTDKGPATRHKTATIEPAAEVPICDQRPIVYDDTSPVGFVKESTTFTDPAAAKAALTQLARWLTANPARTARVIGTTADWGDEKGQVTLSKGRASAVASLLRDLGVAKSQLTDDGVGSDFPEHLEERDSSGNWNSEIAALNRSVRITPAGPDSSCT